VIVGISEFTFGFAFLYEQTYRKWSDLKAVPILPNLKEEAKLGWDAHLPLNGTDFYYQFKLSDYLWRGNAAFIKDGTYSTPYFRIALHRRDGNRQHGRLKAHAQHHPNTFYVAPEIDELDDFNAAFAAHALTDKSRLITVAECEPAPDADQHYITFQKGHSTWNFHSERRPHATSFEGADIEKVYRATIRSWKPVDLRFAEQIFESTRDEALRLAGAEDTLGRLPLLLQPDVKPGDIIGLLSSASLILSVFFGLTLVLVGDSGEQHNARHS
jgi:hypothetical protein